MVGAVVLEEYTVMVNGGAVGDITIKHNTKTNIIKVALTTKGF